MLFQSRTDQEMLSHVLYIAQAEVRIRADWLSGSRVDPAATQDRFSDFDVVYLVNDLPSMVQNEGWLELFGPPLIVQRPDDWYDHPYDLASHAKFAYLMYFQDRQRIDLTLVSINHVRTVLDDPKPEPRRMRVVAWNYDRHGVGRTTVRSRRSTLHIESVIPIAIAGVRFAY